MVYFMEQIVSDQKYLVLLKDHKQTTRSGVPLLVEDPKASRLSSAWPPLDNPTYLSEWSVEKPLNPGSSSKVWFLDSSIHNQDPNLDPELTLGRRIINDEVCWENILKFPGEFIFLPCYWEWLELVVVRALCEAWCPATNTFHTQAGEVSISLWDLWKFGGLPIKGRFYEEVIPSLKELTGSGKHDRFLPKICEYLFRAYYLLTASKADHSHVATHSWISFWFKDEQRYEKPPRKKQRKTSRSDLTHNPDGILSKSREWSSEENLLFRTLNVGEDWKEKTYLVAFLSCWLCAFVFPCKSAAHVRPDVFRVASLMADGIAFSLAIPVLANIYSGLRKISEALPPMGRMEACFPMQYVYGWSAHYFATHYKTPVRVRGPMMVDFSGGGGARLFEEFAARELIHTGASLAWHVNLQHRNKHETIRDNKDLNFEDSSYFFSLRSGCVSSRCGGSLVIETYSPYRFGRQFGFYQDIPNDLGQALPLVDLDNVLSHWRICVRCTPPSRIFLPARVLSPHDQVTERFKSWWSSKHGNYLEEGARKLVNKAVVIKSLSKFTKKVENNFGGKKIRLLENTTAPNDSEQTDESHSSNRDRYFKQDRRSRKTSNPDDHFFDGVPSASRIPDNVEELLPLNDFIQRDKEQPGDQSVADSATSISLKKAVGNSHVPHVKRAAIAPPIAITYHTPQARNQVAALAPEVSHYCADQVISRLQQQAAVSMWQSLQGKLVRTPFEDVTKLEPEVHKILKGISETRTKNLIVLQDFVEGYCKKVEGYNQMQSSLSTQLTSNNKDRQLEENKLKLERGLLTITEMQTDLQAAKTELERLSTLVSEKEKALNQETLEVSHVREKINTLECTPVIDDADARAVAAVRELLESSREELKEFQWIP